MIVVRKDARVWKVTLTSKWWQRPVRAIVDRVVPFTEGSVPQVGLRRGDRAVSADVSAARADEVLLPGDTLVVVDSRLARAAAHVVWGEYDAAAAAVADSTATAATLARSLAAGSETTTTTVEAARRAAAADPRSAEAQLALAVAARDADAARRAASLARSSLSRARALAVLADSVEAARAAVDADSRPPEVHACLARYCEAAGDFDGALASWRQAWRRDDAYRADLADCAERALRTKFAPRSDDVFVVSFPKSGTTFVQAIVLHLLARSPPDDPIAQAPWLEAAVATGHLSLERARDLEAPRVFKTHARPADFPAVSRPRVVVVTRNPKDVCLSLFHHNAAIFDHDCCSWDEHASRFAAGRVPDARAGDWFDWHQAWAREQDVYWVHYERLVRDPKSQISDLATFLRISDVDLDAVVDASAFDVMKRKHEDLMAKCPTPRRKIGAEPHFRRGKVGDWQTAFSDDQSALFDALYRDRILARDDLGGLRHDFF
ncbi:hypothetical protein CTAYLR_001945 [Chrysophaeum taylorii]|uniref:Sulfotransferase domain-containing protein n=1 Tax=Chrysophaeum taylorii TaxID=2483200 RepID=A0AAD7U946_9STRA|nr:hypothetical protein CTAYLR_001945 [Chrysophaeum taylorii]